MHFGNDWKRVQEQIKTRTQAQVRSHAQKYIAKLAKHMLPSLKKFSMDKFKVNRDSCPNVKLLNGQDSTGERLSTKRKVLKYGRRYERVMANKLDLK